MGDSMHVDVLIISESDAAGVAETLRWLKHQTVESWHAVVVERGDVAETAAAVAISNKELGAERVTVIAAGSGRPIGVALNAGVAAGSAPRLAVLRAGDMPLRRYLERLLAAMTPSGGCIACGRAVYMEDGKRIGAVMGASESQFGLLNLLDGESIEEAAVMFDRSLLDGKRYGANLHSAVDLDLWLRTSEDGLRWRSCEAVVIGRPRRPAFSADDVKSAASETIRVIGRSFARAAARGWDEAELSSEREAKAAVRWAFPLATAAAIEAADERLTAATDLLREHAFEHCVTPTIAGDAAADVLTRTTGCSLALDGKSERVWATALYRWWSRCVSERWAEARVSGGALERLAERLTADDRVAAGVLNDLGIPGRMLITGAGPASFAMGDAASAKGWQVSLVAFHDAKAMRALAAAGGERFGVVGVDAVTDSDDPLVITDSDEQLALEHFASRPNVTRWRGARRDLTARTLGSLRAVWPRRGESADL